MSCAYVLQICGECRVVWNLHVCVPNSFVLPFSKCIVAPTAAMVDSRCPVRLQMQLTGEEESDELED